jgi:glutathione S-transferase
MKLYVTPPSPRAFKVVAVMHHLALDAELALVDLLHGDHMKPEFAALNPNRKMPVLGRWLPALGVERDHAVPGVEAPRGRSLAGQPPASGGRQPLAVLGAGALGAGVRHAGVRALRQGTLRPGRPGPGRGRARGARLPPGGAGARPAPARARLAGGSRLTLADVSVGAWLTVAQYGRYPMAEYKEIARWYRGLEALPAWQRATVPAPA